MLTSISRIFLTSAKRQVRKLSVIGFIPTEWFSVGIRKVGLSLEHNYIPTIRNMRNDWYSSIDGIITCRLVTR